MGYEVHLDAFDGPFDLLLRLIAEQQVDVYEIHLAPIVDAFLAEVAALERVDLELATEFLLIAATLVELKVRRLLPGTDDPELDEDLAPYEGRDYLLARLVESQTFQNAAARLLALEQRAARAWGRRAGPDERFRDLAPDLLATITPKLLAERAGRALAPKPVPVVATDHLHTEEVRVADVLQQLVVSLPGRGRTTFRDLTADATGTAAVVACFLALLELYKRSLVDLEQSTTFGELGVTWLGGSLDDLDDLDDYATLAAAERRGR